MVSLMFEHELDLCSIVDWGDRCFLSIAIDRDPLLVPVEMNGTELPEESSCRLLGLTFTRSID